MGLQIERDHNGEALEKLCTALHVALWYTAWALDIDSLIQRKYFLSIKILLDNNFQIPDFLLFPEKILVSNRSPPNLTKTLNLP